MKKIFPKIIDVVCFVGGSALFIGTLFNAKSYGRNGNGNYYYSDSQLFLLVVGIVLIVLGFLIRNWRKEKDKY